MEDERSTEPVLSTLARFASHLALDAVPAEVKHQAKLCILDTLGCMLAGAATDEGRRFAQAELWGLDDRPARTLTPEAYARILGYWGDTYELNDLIGGHASIGNVSTVFAVGRELHASGRNLLSATIAGIEITSRIAEAQARTKKPYAECGMVAISLESSFGTGAAAGLLCGLDEQGLVDAMAIAGTLSSWCPAEVIFGDGRTIKPILFGAAPADAGIRGAGYARQGLTGPPRLLESDIGLFATITRQFDEAVLRDNGRWHLLAPQRKLHASCGFTHSTIDVVGGLHRLGVDFANATRIEIAVPAMYIPAVSKSVPPRTPNEARFHLQYCAALAANGVDAILPTHSDQFASHLARAEVGGLLQKMEVVPMELPAKVTGHPFNHCQVRVEFADGSNQMAEGHTPRGSHGNPLSEEQIVSKFKALAAVRLVDSEIEAAMDLVMNLEHAANASLIYAFFDRDINTVAQSAGSKQ